MIGQDYVGKYVIIRTKNAGVHACILEKIESELNGNGISVEVSSSRRLCRWAGALSISEIAQIGVTLPEECKFSCAIDKAIIMEVIEIIPITEQAKLVLDSIVPWTM